ncbi:MAG: DUF4296 domain-containing protein [Bacteroidota bacterium]
MFKRTLPIFLLIFIFTACSREKNVKIPNNIIPPDKMVIILVDFHLAEAVIVDKQQKKEDVNQWTNYYYSSILLKHNITRKKFRDSMKFYTENIEEMEKIYKEVVVELSKTQSRIISKKI